MNERIRELAEQAIKEKLSLDEFVQAIKDEPHDFWGFRQSELTEFVQLIVQECMNQVREQYMPVLEDELMMKDTHWDGYVQCGVDSYVAIKEHFGVER